MLATTLALRLQSWVLPVPPSSLLLLLQEQVQNGRCTPGEQVKNDREVEFLPAGVSLPKQ